MGSGLFEVSDCKVADTNRPDLSFSVESLKLIVSEIGPVDFGCNNKLVSTDVSQGSSHNLFAVTVSISLCRVHKIYAEFVASRYGADNLLIISLPQVASLRDAYSDSGYFWTVPS